MRSFFVVVVELEPGKFIRTITEFPELFDNADVVAANLTHDEAKELTAA